MCQLNLIFFFVRTIREQQIKPKKVRLSQKHGPYGKTVTIKQKNKLVDIVSFLLHLKLKMACKEVVKMFKGVLTDDSEVTTLYERLYLVYC